ncbi:PLD nuclease N-terminal domain-containing protein [Nodosilinea sp. AN01ver1]|uniref:PLD nuclease N-terminal domain-containing protein n=1 Tax=Nodosilinea sp. AN01ver1 TaxID=3423362 RepID=UPI003D31C333
MRELKANSTRNIGSNKQAKRLTQFLFLGILSATFLVASCDQKIENKAWSQEQFMQAVKQGQIESASINMDRTQATATNKQGEQILVDISPSDPSLADFLIQNQVSVFIDSYDSVLYPFDLAWFLVPGAIALAGFAFWIWMLVDCATQESNSGNTKVVWILIILFANGIGALIYFFFRRPQRRQLGE